MSEKIDPRLIPEVNIGTLGHVDHGKSTLVESIAGKWPSLHSEELKRGITIKLGYADATIYKCTKCGSLSLKDRCMKCMEIAEPLRTVSFVDAPGHETLMATVLAGTSIMDGVLFVIAANEPCPQPQTKEHLTALNVTGIKNIIIVQNKIDLVTPEKAKENYKQIRDFVKGTSIENAPIIPVSAQQKINMDYLLKAIEEFIPTPERDTTKVPKMLVARSFDVNKPGTEIEKLVGGIIGGSIVQGGFSVGQEIEIRPGIKIKNRWESIFTKINGLQKAGKNLDEAGSGGLLGMMTELDPALTKADSLAGSVVGLPGKLPDTLHKVSINFHLFGDKKIKVGDVLMITVGTARTVGNVASLRKSGVEIDLKLPICAERGNRVALSQKIADKFKLIGYGEIA